MADFPKKQQQCLIPKYLLDYLGEVNELHPDPSDLGGGDNIEPGTGIVITGDDTKTISVDDETVAMVANLSTVAFSGSYSNLSDKPDLSVYELKEDAFSGDYADLTNKPDLSVYAETADLGDCAYLDENELSIAYSQITGTPSIPTKTSDLTNDSGYITGVTWNDVTGKPTFATVATTGDYDDLINKPTIPVVPTNVSAFNNDAGYITGITSSDVTTALGYTPGTSNFSGSYTDLTDKPTIPTATSQLTNDSGYITSASLTGYVPFEEVTGTTKLINAGNYYGVGYEPGLTNYNMLTSTRNTFKLPVDKSGTIALLSDIPSIPQNIPSLSGDNTWTGYNAFGQTTTNTLYTNVLTVPDAVSTNTPQLKVRDYGSQALTEYSITIPMATGTLALTSDIPSTSNFVTTNTSQNITGVKTFVGSKLIKFKQSSSSDKLGFTCYNSSNNEKAYLEYNPTDDGLYLGRHGNYRVNELGFKTSDNSRAHKLLVPNVTLSGNVTDYIPISVNNTKADSSGNISIAIPTVPTNVSAFTNDAGYITSSAVPTTATSTSTSTVTPTTVTLTFTYSDDTTENVTLMTSASVSTTTTTTLS